MSTGTGIPMGFQDFQLRMRAQKEADRRRKTETTEMLQQYRGGVSEDDKKLSAIRQEDRKKQLDAEKLLHSYQCKTVETKKKEQRQRQDVPHPPPVATKEADDPSAMIAEGCVSALKANFNNSTGTPTATPTKVGPSRYSLSSPNGGGEDGFPSPPCLNETERAVEENLDFNSSLNSFKETEQNHVSPGNNLSIPELPPVASSGDDPVQNQTVDQQALDGVADSEEVNISFIVADHTDEHHHDEKAIPDNQEPIHEQTAEQVNCSPQLEEGAPVAPPFAATPEREVSTCAQPSENPFDGLVANTSSEYSSEKTNEPSQWVASLENPHNPFATTEMTSQSYDAYATAQLSLSSSVNPFSQDSDDPGWLRHGQQANDPEWLRRGTSDTCSPRNLGDVMVASDPLQYLTSSKQSPASPTKESALNPLHELTNSEQDIVAGNSTFSTPSSNNVVEPTLRQSADKADSSKNKKRRERPPVVRLDVTFSFGLRTAEGVPSMEPYMKAVEDVVQKVLDDNQLSPLVSFNPTFRPSVVDMQWDENYTDPFNRTHVKRVLVTASVPLFLKRRVSIRLTRNTVVAALQDAINSGSFLKLAQSIKDSKR